MAQPGRGLLISTILSVVAGLTLAPVAHAQKRVLAEDQIQIQQRATPADGAFLSARQLTGGSQSFDWVGTV